MRKFKMQMNSNPKLEKETSQPMETAFCENWT